MTTAIFILGMHRSGTSALARVLNLLGVELGTKLMPPAADNEKGFWEHEEIVAIHERLLRELGHSWQDGTPLAAGWGETYAAQQASQALGKVIDREFANAPLWGVKDPRHCLLVPIWEPLLKARGIDIKIVLMWRYPNEVAASLVKRDNMDRYMATYAWVGYNLHALKACLDYPHSIVSYEALMQDWRLVVDQISHELELQWPVSKMRAKAQIDAFIEPGLRHHISRGMYAHNWPHFMAPQCLKLLEEDFDKTFFKELYNTYYRHSFSLQQILPEVRKEAWQWQRQMLDERHRAEDMTAQLESLKAEHNRVLAERDIALQELALMKDSASWKLTQPLRTLKAAAKKESHGN
jgi:hypothetical protein